MYFAKFPTYEYDLQNNDKRTLITDILRRVNLKSNVKANTLVFDQYNVKDGEQSTIVAHRHNVAVPCGGAAHMSVSAPHRDQL